MIAGLLIVILMVLVVGGMFVLSILGSLTSPRESEQERIRSRVRQAEWRLHRVAGDAFQAMLDEARRHQQQR